MTTEPTQQGQSSFMHNVQLCLALCGYILLGGSGALLIRWSLEYASVGKFTYIGAVIIILALVMIGRTFLNSPERNNQNKTCECTLFRAAVAAQKVWL